MSSIFELGTKVLLSYPLCDRCLGRLFACLGRGISNEERGKAIKLYVIMELHRRYLEGDSEALSLLTQLLPNAMLEEAWGITGTQKPIHREPENRCYICGNTLQEIVSKYGGLITDDIVKRGIKRFLVGVKVPKELLEREELVANTFRLAYRESIKRELKREIGKYVQRATQAVADFENPEAIYVVDLERDELKIETPSLLIYGLYRKLGRMIARGRSTRHEIRDRRALAVEDAILHAKDLVGANDALIHVTGREDPEVRVLGRGRPLVIEFRSPANRNVSLHELELALNSFSPWIKFRLKLQVGRRFLANMKGSLGRQFEVYRVLVYSEKGLEVAELKTLEDFYRNRIVEQRIPSRDGEVVRKGRVIAVKVIGLTRRLFEALVKCDGGLHVKLLVTGSDGASIPSFSEVLGTPLRCLVADLAYVHEYI